MDGCTVNMRTGLYGTTERTPLRNGRIHVLPCVIGPGTRAFARPGVVSCGRAPHSPANASHLHVTYVRQRAVSSPSARAAYLSLRASIASATGPRLRAYDHANAVSIPSETTSFRGRFTLFFLAATSASSPETGGIGLGADPAAITSIPGKNYPKASPAVRLRPQPSRGNGTAGTHPRRLCRARSAARGLCR